MRLPYFACAIIWSLTAAAWAQKTQSQTPVSIQPRVQLGDAPATSADKKSAPTRAAPEQENPSDQTDFASVAQTFKILPHGFPTEGVLVGQGWDSFFDHKTNGFCVVGNIVTDESIASTKLSFERIEDKEHIFRSLQIDASASFNGGVFSASGKADYSNSLQVDSSSLNVLASVRTDRAMQTLVPSSLQKQSISAGSLRLSDEALSLRKTDKKAFESRCGDSFVLSVRLGGEFDAYLQFSVFEGETKDSLFASVKAGGLSGSGSATLKQTIETKQNKQAFRYNLFQTGQSTGLNPTSPDDFIKKFTTFGTEQDFKPSPYEIYLISYSQLETGGLPSEIMPTNKYMSRIATHYSRLMNMYSEYEDVIRQPGAYYVSMFFRSPADIYEFSGDILTASQLQDKALTNCVVKRSCDEERVTGDLAAMLLAHTPVPNALTKAVSASGLSRGDQIQALLDAAKSKTQEEVPVALIKTLSPEDQYYFWLASRPFKISEINPKSFLFADAKAAYKPGVDPSDLKSLQDFASREARQWILINRLMPVSESFCQESARHWMCSPPSHLRNIVDQVNIVIPPEYLKPEAPPAPTPAPTPVHVPDAAPVIPREYGCRPPRGVC